MKFWLITLNELYQWSTHKGCNSIANTLKLHVFCIFPLKHFLHHNFLLCCIWIWIWIDAPCIFEFEFESIHLPYLIMNCFPLQPPALFTPLCTSTAAQTTVLCGTITRPGTRRPRSYKQNTRYSKAPFKKTTVFWGALGISIIMMVVRPSYLFNGNSYTW